VQTEKHLLLKLALAFTISTLFLRVQPRAEDLKMSELQVRWRCYK
jgi:hypothetical protein